MDFGDILKAVVSAVIAYTVPKILAKAGKTIDPDAQVPWLSWSIAGLIGGAAGGIASGLFGMFDLGLEGFGNWAGYGAALGLAQWFVLHNYREVGAWWPVASTLGWMAFNFGGPWGGWVVAGLLIGLLQYISLQKYKGAGGWIFANLIAWPIAGGIGYLVGLAVLPFSFELAWVIGWGIVGLAGNILLIAPLGRLSSTDSCPPTQYKTISWRDNHGIFQKNQ